MRYLVTGGAGFIGSHIVDALVSGDIQHSLAAIFKVRKTLRYEPKTGLK